MFEGFTQETSDFLWDLSFNNERPWFLAHKEQFERCLNQPFKALAQETWHISAKSPRKRLSRSRTCSAPGFATTLTANSLPDITRRPSDPAARCCAYCDTSGSR